MIADSENNIKFKYLFRDEGNYKDYGHIVFSNPDEIPLIDIDSKIRSRLIDFEFFYPKKWGIPFFDITDKLFDHWFEYEGVEATNDLVTENISITTFLNKTLNLKKYY